MQDVGELKGYETNAAVTQPIVNSHTKDTIGKKKLTIRNLHTFTKDRITAAHKSYTAAVRIFVAESFLSATYSTDGWIPGGLCHPSVPVSGNCWKVAR